MVLLFAALGWLVDRQLWAFATMQLEDRVSARSKAVLGADVEPQPPVTVALPVAPAPPAAPVPPVGARPVTRPATRISSPISSLAEKAAASDPSGVRTTIIGP